MRIGVALAVLALVGCSGETETAKQTTTARTAPTTVLKISLWASGADGPVKSWTLSCPPPGGTLPGAEQACSQLASAKDPFAPVPKDSACTMIYGGPEVATVRGLHNGQPVNAKFSRTDGCEIARWQQVQFLFPNLQAVALTPLGSTGHFRRIPG